LNVATCYITNPVAVKFRRMVLVFAATGLYSLGLSTIAVSQDSSTGAVVNPFLGDEAAITEGRRIYRSKCIVCHQRTGGRAKNLFKTRLTDEQFLEVVINGREGTLMPTFGYRMGVDDVWKVHAYVKSADHYY
jgi:mono/diheme cytochrome c family protein